MIKLIACDMDGTLLHDDKTFNPEIFELIFKLYEKGCYFAAASGRQLNSLKNVFSPVKDNMIYIAENGTFVYYKGEEIYSNFLNKDSVKRILDVVTRFEIIPMLCGKYCSYTNNEKFVKILQSSKFFYNTKFVDNLYDVNDDILKVSIDDRKGIEENTFNEIYPQLSNMFEATVSGFTCMDFVNKGVSKGTAIELIQQKFNIKPEETLVFGDNYNDTEMFKFAKYSYAMENASDGVKAQANFIAKNNNNDGVIEEIKKLCFN